MASPLSPNTDTKRVIMNTTPIETDECLQAELLSYAACLRFCAILLRYPDQAVYATLEAALPLFDDLHAALLSCPNPVLPPLVRLQLSYTALFVANPAGLPAVPYVSCRLEAEGRTYGAATQELRKQIANEGVKVDSIL